MPDLPTRASGRRRDLKLECEEAVIKVFRVDDRFGVMSFLDVAISGFLGVDRIGEARRADAVPVRTGLRDRPEAGSTSPAERAQLAERPADLVQVPETEWEVHGDSGASAGDP